MHVRHLYHSGFVVELNECVLLFDWYPREFSELTLGPKLPQTFDRLYVFVSHTHKDHYAPAIWKLGEKYSKAKVAFIVDKEVAAMAPDDDSLDVVSCEPEQIYEIDELMEVTTLKSTDEGLAFCVDVCGKTIYHAGDLSVWWWPNRDVLDNMRSESNCHYYLEILEDKHIDLATLPITPRAGADGDRGIELFMVQVGADVVVPMHYGEMRAEAMELANSNRLARWRDRIRFDESFDQ